MSHDRTIVKLKHPVKLGEKGDLVDQLAFRRGRMGDLKSIPMGQENLPWDAIMLIASRMSGQFPQLIDQLDEEDIGEVKQIALDFYVRAHLTGPTE